MIGNDQIIGINAAGVFGDTFEEVGVRHPIEREGGVVFLVDGLDLDAGRPGRESAHNKPGAVAEGMHAQQLMRRAVSSFDQTAKLFMGQDHRASKLAEGFWNAKCQLKSKRKEDTVELLLVDIEAGFSPDDKIGKGHLLFDGPLGANALVDLFGRPSTVEETLTLSGGGTGNANGGVEFGLGVGFEKEGDNYAY